ncbi:hypothetical protein [Pseudobacter ginsenosidimutans]|uniref:Uncharacterized protein n=1 Tax=Pseudobacter ginsenosidimutans TaxID=661488 RepID=A0A4Q7N3Q5_9BACT|nr:hypothetical protein [Pseudobacter ginsenosidimutans]QEC44155.1 hypothetical protein FSB84_21655 [Pseudobacter ginsenosidimutans]RZS75603.1 hypothetical protein EV199_1472 [Pseudobacter ginsenosidimutans]
MAKQTGQFPFTGRIGNVIGYKRNGVHFIRSMPDEVQQTIATRKAAKNFGIASSKGSLVRRAFAQHLDVYGDRGRVNRLNKTLIESEIQGLQGYQFNQFTSIRKFFRTAPVLDENNNLHIPAQTLPGFSIKAASLEVKLIAVKIDFTTRRVIDSVSTVAIINLDLPFTGLNMEAQVNGNGTLMMTLQVRLIHSDLPAKERRDPKAPANSSWFTKDRRYFAADLIAVLTPVTQQAGTKYKKKLARPWPGKHRPMLLNKREPLQHTSNNFNRKVTIDPIVYVNWSAASHIAGTLEQLE